MQNGCTKPNLNNPFDKSAKINVNKVPSKPNDAAERMRRKASLARTLSQMNKG